MRCGCGVDAGDTSAVNGSAPVPPSPVPSSRRSSSKVVAPDVNLSAFVRTEAFCGSPRISKPSTMPAS
eukprot:scaffold492_cov257-Pinguiococcus_pyrenoidosus.AAC.32